MKKSELKKRIRELKEEVEFIQAQYAPGPHLFYPTWLFHGSIPKWVDNYPADFFEHLGWI